MSQSGLPPGAPFNLQHAQQQQQFPLVGGAARGIPQPNMPPYSSMGDPMGVAVAGPSVLPQSIEDSKRRFEIECEFVQALANPHYLNYLAQRGYFKENYFVNYLKYLLYFKRPEYARTLKFPQCLFFLEALQSAEFREEMASSANSRYIEDQQMLHWQYDIRKRHRLQQFSQPVTAEKKADGKGSSTQANSDAQSSGGK